MDKITKLSVCLGFALAGWLIPASMSLLKPLQGISLGFALTATIAGVSESRRETVRHRFAKTERDQEFEFFATETILRHERRLKKLYEELGFGEDFDDDQGANHSEQERLTGGHINQVQLPHQDDRGIEQFDLDWLLRSPNLHLLITGDTGDGKTTLTRWIAKQFNAQQGKVYDPDYDGSDWGFPAVSAPLEDYSEIQGNMRVDLQEFERRKPNDPANPKTVLIVEEMPSTIPECGEDGEKWLKLLLRRGRKRNLFVIGVSQDRNADSFKLKSAGVLSNFTVIYLGGYGFHALDRVRNRQEREQIREQLNGFTRPALVQFKGRFYPWDVPSLTSNDRHVQATPAEQTLGDPAVTTLNRCLSQDVEASLEHCAIVDLSGGKWISVRDAMRAISKIKAADQCKAIFQELVILELGETRQDDRYPDRLLFRSY